MVGAEQYLSMSATSTTAVTGEEAEHQPEHGSTCHGASSLAGAMQEAHTEGGSSSGRDLGARDGGTSIWDRMVAQTMPEVANWAW